MTSPTSPRTTRSRPNPWAVAGILTALGFALVIGVAVAADERPAAMPRTGEISSMGMPIVETPGNASGSVEGAGVVVDAAQWAMGQVPLDTAVVPSWVLRNTGDEPVTIGEPHPEIRAGCCPGPFGLDRQVIQPGEEATLTFELSMHQGMDGWHDIAVHVPVMTGSQQAILDLEVTGDFRNS